MRIKASAFAMGVFVGALTASPLEFVLGADRASTPKPAGAIAGRVLDGAGKPVVGVVVHLFATNGDDRPMTQLRASKTGADGEFQFENLPNDSYVLAANPLGFARAYHVVSLNNAEHVTSDIGLRKPGELSIVVNSADGKPVPRARVRELWQNDVNGRIAYGKRAFEDKAFNLEVPPSDDAGRISLPSFPQGAAVNLTIDHDDFAPVRLTDVIVKPRTTAGALMHRGVTLTLRLDSKDLAEPLSQLDVTLYHEPLDHPSSYVNEAIPFDKHGIARLTVEPGSYSRLYLGHAAYLVGPRIATDISRGKFLSIAVGKNDQFSFEAHRKVVARGRIVDETTGKPITDGYVAGEVLFPGASNAAGVPSSKWMRADWVKTNEKGEYTMHLAAGRARVLCAKENFTADPVYLEFSVGREGPTTIPEMRVHPTPKVRGTVFYSDGRPAPKTVVRFRGPEMRWVVPTVTDARGQFELQPRSFSIDDDKPVLVHPLVAFHAYEALAAQIDVDLGNPKAFSDIRLQLRPQPYERQLDEVAGEWTSWERNDRASARVQGRSREAMRGQPAPELDCHSWLNVPRGTSKLADFRGRYVFLDFWTTWCGPCRRDYSSVRLAHELYNEHGLTVIGVHDNSVVPQLVREYVEREKMPFPIAIDQADGRTLAAYDRQCGVNGYPTYLLLGRDGRILNADSILPAPMLQSFKIEIIRAHVMGKSSQSAKQ